MPLLHNEEAGASAGGDIPADTLLTAELTAVQFLIRKKGTPDEYRRHGWKFIVREPGSPFDGVALWGDTPEKMTMHENNPTRQWAEALNGYPIPVGDFNTDDLVGAECRIMVGARPYEKDGEQRVHNFVADVIPSARSVRLNAGRDEEPF